MDGMVCGASDLTCWTHCNAGMRGQLQCSGGRWLAGHGLFPCDTAVDAAAAKQLAVERQHPPDPVQLYLIDQDH
jgi:hypothetical protein